MIHYQVLRNIWAILSVLAGLALLFITILVYFDFWRPRSEQIDKKQEKGSTILLIWKTIPWSLKISYFILIIWAVLYGIYLIANPPNW